jgi:hypothetical protein
LQSYNIRAERDDDFDAGLEEPMAQLTASKVQVYRFYVDGKPFESAEQVITGEQLHVITQIPPRMRIFVGDHGRGSPDHQITKTSTVDLAEVGKAQFYTLAPPSYDIF